MLLYVKWILIGLQLLSAVLLVVLVLLHSPKGDGIGGLGASAQLFTSQRGAEAALNKLTYSIVAVFMGTSFILGYYF